MNTKLLSSIKKSILNEPYLAKLNRGLFHEILGSYVQIETTALKGKFHDCLSKFYASQEHQRKELTEQEFADYEQSLFSTAAGMLMGKAQTTILLSESVATSMLPDTKIALKRCNALSFGTNKAENATEIFTVLLKYLGRQHILYGLDVCLGNLPTGTALQFPKTEPSLRFLEVIQAVSTIWHLAEKLFADDVLGMITSTPSHSKCLELKSKVRADMEAKSGEVIDRALSLAVGWLRTILKTRQRAVDFSEQNAEMCFGSTASSASRDVCASVSKSISEFQMMLDGDNEPAVLCELGTRFHGVVRDHLMSFKGQIGMMGGLMVVSDMTAYMEASRKFGIPLVEQLFETLHAVCNLLVQPPEHIRQVCTGESLANLDREVLLGFVQLRSDCSKERLEKYFT